MQAQTGTTNSPGNIEDTKIQHETEERGSTGIMEDDAVVHCANTGSALLQRTRGSKLPADPVNLQGFFLLHSLPRDLKLFFYRTEKNIHVVVQMNVCHFCLIYRISPKS